MPRAEDTDWEFRLSTDGTLFAFYDPGNGPWFVPKAPLEEWVPDPRLEGWNIPEPWMKGRFVESGKIDGFGFEWIRFLPAPVAAREVLRVIAEWADGEPEGSDAAARLAFQNPERKTMGDERARALEISLRQLRVASALLIDEYERIQKTGQFENPQLAAAALHEVDQMVTSLAVAGLDKVRYDGSHVNELIRRGEESAS